MAKVKKTTLDVRGTEVTVLSQQDGDFISLTDMLKAKDGDFFISDWLRNRNTVKFLGIWESVHNPGSCLKTVRPELVEGLGREMP